MPSNKPCTWNGIEYPSLAEAARATGVHATTMRYRLKMGYTCDADLGGAKDPRRRATYQVSDEARAEKRAKRKGEL